MTEHGAALQTYNQELIKWLEEFKTKRDNLFEVIQRQEAEKSNLDKNIKILQEKLYNVDGSLQQLKKLYENYDKHIKETESGFKKIVESSEALLKVAQHNANKLENIGFIPQQQNNNENHSNWKSDYLNDE